MTDPQELSVELILDAPTPTVVLSGIFDLSNADLAAQHLADVVAARPAEIVLDLSQTTFFDSRAVAVVIEAAQELQEGKLVIRGATDRFVEQITLAGADGLLTFDGRLDGESPATG